MITISDSAWTQEDIRSEKRRFWISWIASNAIGMAFGLCLGQYFGQIAYSRYGEKSGLLVAALAFELCIWTARLIPSQYFSRQRLLKFLDVLVWSCTEVFGWIVFEILTVPLAPNYLVMQVMLISNMGVLLWIMFASIGLLKVFKKTKSKKWFEKAFVDGLVGFVVGSAVISSLETMSMSVGEFFGKIINPYAGWAISGLLIGGLLGAITGFILSQAIDWNKSLRAAIR